MESLRPWPLSIALLIAKWGELWPTELALEQLRCTKCGQRGANAKLAAVRPRLPAEPMKNGRPVSGDGEQVCLVARARTRSVDGPNAQFGARGKQQRCRIALDLAEPYF